jgi:hypothetical protein
VNHLDTGWARQDGAGYMGLRIAALLLEARFARRVEHCIVELGVLVLLSGDDIFSSLNLAAKRCCTWLVWDVDHTGRVIAMICPPRMVDKTRCNVMRCDISSGRARSSETNKRVDHASPGMRFLGLLLTATSID